MKLDEERSRLMSLPLRQFTSDTCSFSVTVTKLQATRGDAGLDSGLSQVSFCFLVYFTHNRTFVIFLF